MAVPDPDPSGRSAGLTALACPTCASPVPLGEAEWSACPSCGARVPLPAEYRALRDAAWELQASDERARDLERRLNLRGPTPRWLVLIGNDLAYLVWLAAAPFVGIRATRAAAGLLD